MASSHSFFIPDLEYLKDLSGLISFLGERIAVDNTCIFCLKKNREFRSVDAVRKHMIDKGHGKIAYDTESERLAVSDFYDFSSSYPTAPGGRGGSFSKRRRVKLVVPDAELVEDEGWEDFDHDEEDGEFDEVVEDGAAEPEELEDEGDSDDGVGESQITYGDTIYELVLPSGARIGHRSLHRYYKQSFANPLPSRAEDPNSGVGLVRRLIGDKNSSLVPVKGGYGAFGSGTMTVKARNKGEAKEAGRHIREFRDQQRREQFKTKVGFVHNYQKHFRDPLLQVRVYNDLSFRYSAAHVHPSSSTHSEGLSSANTVV
jgi:pre-60S factor REI1